MAKALSDEQKERLKRTFRHFGDKIKHLDTFLNAFEKMGYDKEEVTKVVTEDAKAHLKAAYDKEFAKINKQLQERLVDKEDLVTNCQGLQSLQRSHPEAVICAFQRIRRRVYTGCSRPQKSHKKPFLLEKRTLKSSYLL